MKMVYNYTSESDDCLIISKSPSPLEVLLSQDLPTSPYLIRDSFDSLGLEKYSSDSDAACANFLPKLRLSLISILSRNELNQEFPAIHTTCPDSSESEIEPSDPDFHLSLRYLVESFVHYEIYLGSPDNHLPRKRDSIEGFV